MKGLKLDNQGDLIIANGNVEMVHDEVLKSQTCRTVIGTNKGEWELDPDEGIDFHNILRKHALEEDIRNEVLSGLQQVDEDLVIDQFSMEVEGRRTKIQFKGGSIDGTKTYE